MSPHPPLARETRHFGDHVHSAWAWPCTARTKAFVRAVHGHAHASQGIICQTIPVSGEPPNYLGGCLPALFAITGVHTESGDDGGLPSCFCYFIFLSGKLPPEPMNGLIPLLVNRYHKSILLIIKYKNLKSCSKDFVPQNLILRTRSCVMRRPGSAEERDY